MRNFADELGRQIESAKLSQAALSTATGISQAQIWKWINAEQISINPEQLDGIAKALKASAQDHARLLVAHLEDERFGKAASLVRIEMDTPQELHDMPKPHSKGEAAMQHIAQLRLKSRNVNDMVIDLARCLGAEI